LTQIEEGPETVGTGNGLTVTFLTVALAAIHPLPSVYLTLIHWDPAVFHVTVMILVPAPLVIVPPADIFQIYPVISGSVEYETPAVASHTITTPVMVGTGSGLTITFLTVGITAVQPFPSK
jgi:hypothetical protein